MEAKKKAKTGKETAGKEGMRFPREVEVVNIERNNRVGARCMYGVCKQTCESTKGETQQHKRPIDGIFELSFKVAPYHALHLY